MDSLVKIRDVSLRYGVSNRTLVYYEEMGLLQSTKGEGYAYRQYDEAAVKRLEQILVLRKLNISIKDIQRIFSTPGSDVVLEVLNKKADDIDDEIALLRELKEIVLIFIQQIKDADFSKDSDVKLLYEKARDIETQLANADYSGNPSPVHRLFEVTEKLEEKAVSRLQIPDNVLKRLMENVYFILDGAAVADALGCKYGMYVYHTCEHRHIHHKNADPQFQPGLCRYEANIPDYFAQDPEDARQREHDIVHDYTPMVIMDLIQLATKHGKVICENAIDVDSILPIVTHAIEIVDTTPSNGLDDFIHQYENHIRDRDISEDEKDRLIRKVHAVWKFPENPPEIGVKQIFWDVHSTVEKTTDEVAEYFGLM